MDGTPIHVWVVFGIVVAVALAIDVLAFRHRVITLRSALFQSACWIGLAAAFDCWLYFALGLRPSLDFLAGYLIEKSLSLDNLFVFLVIFRAFGVPAESQHKVLYGGVTGALVLRAIFVVAGVELLELVHALTYVFGAFLLLVGLKMLLSRQRAAHPERSWPVRIAERLLPVTARYEGDKFWIKNGRWQATPLLMALIALEAMDIVFAVDSVPAVLAITRNVFVAFSSNAFAILGLRALYFAVADIFPRFRFLHQGVAAILVFVGLKMALGEVFPVSTPASLGIIATILALAVGTSLVVRKTPGATEA
ncbi:MAG TPA: TerC/Alx family metal homeostasis membrane protein [Candidatus Acidoferrum sp.]|nr:TerC/Alx family metal homeostasis membrane protein [Candidatus Acidoferrum sp.]